MGEVEKRWKRKGRGGEEVVGERWRRGGEEVGKRWKRKERGGEEVGGEVGKRLR